MPKRTKVICLNTGQTWPSICAAARALRMDAPAIQRVIVGDRRSARGLIFEECPESISFQDGNSIEYAERRLIERAKGVIFHDEG